MTTSSELNRPYPNPSDPRYAAHLVGLAEGRYVITRCRACDAVQWPPRDICGLCRTFEFDAQELVLRGSVYTHSTVHRAFQPWFASITPYVVAAVECEEGVRVLGMYDGARGSVRCGLPVRGSVEDMGGHPAVVWRPAVEGRG